MANSTGEPVSADEALLASLRQFIRAHGAEYLEDPNISSIGVGYKIADGQPTTEISLQFTVDQKVAPEDLDSLRTTAIPETIVVDGVAVPTDVIERSYAPAYRVVAEEDPPQAKLRADPVRPGISVGNVHVSAGTIGCIVYDKHEGTPLILSNWHVLHGGSGAIGDIIVQPGPHDDNRIAANRLGRLRRSHLGVAGDCAVASIDDRRFETEILGLGLSPTQLGEPALGDRVVKSGRTTGVTHGVVRRIDTIAKIFYNAVGEHAIGCFEIGPDPLDPPADGEISKGGDSGAAWMFKTSSGQTSSVLAGLHFAGETGTSTDEHALACLPQSVFEKLEVTLRQPDSHDTTEAEHRGYAAEFLGTRIELPTIDASLRDDTVGLDGSDIIRYTHFSLALSKSRRFARWVAWNIDGGSLTKIARKGIAFVKDPRIPAEFQCGNELYGGNRIDRGHIARRADLIWGAKPVAARANTDSFFFTNITPQMDDFNQSSKDGVWGRIEDALFADVEVADLRVSVFSGPVFQDDDRVYRGTPLPREYWKILAFVEQGELKTRAFLLTQNLTQLEALELDEFRVFQVAVTEVEERTNVRFADEMRDSDTFAVPEAIEDRQPLGGPADIHW